MWPLLKKDGLCWQYGTLIYLYNYLIGYNPFKFVNRSAVDGLAIVTYALIGLIHLSEMMIASPERLPDLYAVLNLTLSFGIFSLGYLWSLMRLLEEGWGLVGLTSKSIAVSAPPSIKPDVEVRPPSRTATISTHGQKADSILPGPIFIEEDEVPRDPSKNKRATSLQARPKKTTEQVLSDDEAAKTRSLKGIASAPHKAVLRMKPMISTPGAEKLMNRIRNRVNSDHVNSRSKLGVMARNRLLKEPSSSTTAVVGDVIPSTSGLSEDVIKPPTRGLSEDVITGGSGLSEDSLRPTSELSEEVITSTSGILSSEYDMVPTLSDSLADQEEIEYKEEEGEASIYGGASGTTKIEVVEQDWEAALRHSREGAIRRRREELRLGGTGKGIQVGGYVDAVDLVNGPNRR